MKRNDTFSFVIKYLKPYWGWELLLLLLLLITTACSLASPYIIKVIIDEVFPSKDYAFLVEILSILVGIYVIRIVLSFFSDYLDTWVSNRIVKTLRNELFLHIIRLPMNFFSQNKSGDILHRISSEVDNVKSAITESLIKLIDSLFSIIFIVIMLSFLNWKLFLITSLIFPLTFLNVRYFQPKIKKIVEKNRLKDSAILSYLSERFVSIKLVKIYNAYKFEREKFNNIQDEYIKTDLKTTILSSGTRSVSTFLIALSPILVFGWGGKQVLNGSMTLGILIAFLQYLNRLYGPLRDIMGLYVEIIGASVSINRIMEFLNTPIHSNSGKVIEAFKPTNKISFNKIVFKYDKRSIIDGLTLNLEIGKKYALVGKSGSGKSTLINLLCNFYEPDSGMITIDGLPLNHIEVNGWRNQISLVSQDTLLFNERIIDNLKYGNTADEKRIRAITSLTLIHDQIELMEHKYDTIIGDQGAKLSGGQKQRIAIARCILKDSPIIILDEATSALDSITESKIISNLFDTFPDKTFILISHRQSTIKNVDKIICFKDGEIAEIGNHSQLSRNNSYYCELFKDQNTIVGSKYKFK
ncbi:ABC transporter ATP-binding protein [Maribacter flavus]|uniref:ABC transporter ATP-binding protein n=1 Tax=Maribacter flavus TaxID=1658664 RepID=A0A5B2TPD0_9FLAO|nr:ABC transporter ATP-binding protein [Maribacter flavus]KAA2215805.1 ABC transporter ATP-binding protein [Maribacter flavus]